jgi:hypothetical protein
MIITEYMRPVRRLSIELFEDDIATLALVLDAFLNPNRGHTMRGTRDPILNEDQEDLLIRLRDRAEAAAK